MRWLALLLMVAVAVTPAAAVAENLSTASNQTGDPGAAGDARSSQSFGGEDGPQYSLTLTTTNTTPALVEDRVEDVYTGSRAVEFTGYIQLPTPCHGISTLAEESNHTLNLTLTPDSPQEACVQQVVTKQYRLDLQSTEAFRLNLMHGDEHLETFETDGYPPETDNGGEGLMAAVLGFLQSLL